MDKSGVSGLKALKGIVLRITRSGGSGSIPLDERVFSHAMRDIADPSELIRGTSRRASAKTWTRVVQKGYPKKASTGGSAMHPLAQSLLGGFESELVKQAAPPVQAAAQAALKAAPKAEGVAQKIVSVMRKRPVLTAATAAAAGAGAATGTAQAKAKAEAEARRREQVRQLLMARLSEGGYFG